MVMKKHFIPVTICLTLIFSLLLSGCDNNVGINPEITTSLSSSATNTSSLTISNNITPSKIAFADNLPELKSAFGNKTYDFFTICISGIVNKNDVYINAIPTKNNDETLYPSDDQSLLAYYTDYFQLAIKVPSNIKTIKQIDQSQAPQEIDINRLMNGYYYLNLKWLNLSADKTQLKAFEYDNNNYYLIEFFNSENQIYSSMIVKIIIDIIFV